MWELTQISIDLVCSSEILIPVCRKLPVILTAAVKQSAKVLGPLVYLITHVQSLNYEEQPNSIIAYCKAP